MVRPDGRAGAGAGGCWCACGRGVLLVLRQVRFRFMSVGGVCGVASALPCQRYFRFEGVAASSKYEESCLGIECSSVELIDYLGDGRSSGAASPSGGFASRGDDRTALISLPVARDSLTCQNKIPRSVAATWGFAFLRRLHRRVLCRVLHQPMIIPAPTVLFVDSSMRMKAPVARESV